MWLARATLFLQLVDCLRSLLSLFLVSFRFLGNFSGGPWLLRGFLQSFLHGLLRCFLRVLAEFPLGMIRSVLFRILFSNGLLLFALVNDVFDGVELEGFWGSGVDEGLLATFDNQLVSKSENVEIDLGEGSEIASEGGEVADQAIGLLGGAHVLDGVEQCGQPLTGSLVPDFAEDGGESVELVLLSQRIEIDVLDEGVRVQN